MNIEVTLEKIMGRLNGRAGTFGLAVFVRPDGEVKTTTTGTELYHDTMRAHPERLLAIYDEDADDRWVRDDLRWASVNMVAS